MWESKTGGSVCLCVPARGWRFLFKDSRQLMLLAACNISFICQEQQLYLYAKNAAIRPAESALGQVVSYLALSHTLYCCEFNGSSVTAPDSPHVHSCKCSSSIFSPNVYLLLTSINSPFFCKRPCSFKLLGNIFKTLYKLSRRDKFFNL